MVAQTILENPVPAPGSPDAPATPTASSTTVRLLISHLLIGSVIGKGGAKIRQIQDVSGARMVASKDMLPQSTERVVEVSGSAEGIRLAVAEIAKCLIEDWDRSQGTVLYHPGSEGMGHGGVIGGGVGQGFPAGAGVQGGVLGGPGGSPYGSRRISGGAPGYQGNNPRRSSGGQGEFQSSPRRNSSSGGAQVESDPNFREQKISIPSDMVYVLIFTFLVDLGEADRLFLPLPCLSFLPH